MDLHRLSISQSINFQSNWRQPLSKRNSQRGPTASLYILVVRTQTKGLAGWIGFAGRFEFEI